MKFGIGDELTHRETGEKDTIIQGSQGLYVIHEDRLGSICDRLYCEDEIDRLYIKVKIPGRGIWAEVKDKAQYFWHKKKSLGYTDGRGRLVCEGIRGNNLGWDNWR